MYIHYEIRAPKALEATSSFIVDTIAVQKGDRVHQKQILTHLRTANQELIPIAAPHDGWIRSIAVKKRHSVQEDELLFVLDILTTQDYRVDEHEVNPSTELGIAGRRGLEREGQRKLVTAYSGELFEALERQNGQHKLSQAVKIHPLVSRAKEGVPPKMSAEVTNNTIAIERFIEEAAHDPALQKQLSHQLEQQLNIQSSPSSAPSPKA